MNKIRRHLTCLCITIAAIAAPVFSQQAAQEPAEHRLAQRLAASALTILRVRPLTPNSLETAAGVLEVASDLAPDDVELWRLTLSVADLAENYELQSKAIRAIVRR